MRALIAIMVVVFALSGCDLDGDTASAGDVSAVDDGTAAATTDAIEPVDEPDPHTATDKPTDPTRAGETGTPEPATPKPRRTQPSRPQPDPKPKPGRRQQAEQYRVLEVVDGDTVKVAYHGGVSVRVIGIDTPETVHPSVPDECGGPPASQAATKLLTGKHVQLVFDPTQGRLDTYGRTLAYLHIPGIGDFGELMVRSGHAIEYTYDTAYRNQN